MAEIPQMASPRLFKNPHTGLPEETTLATEEFNQLCPERRIPLPAGEPIAEDVLVRFNADFNGDGIPDFLFGYRLPQNPALVRLFLTDGKRGEPDFGDFLPDDDDSLLRPEYFGDFALVADAFCVADADHDASPDFLRLEPDKDKNFVPIVRKNHLLPWKQIYFDPRRLPEGPAKESLIRFEKDWEALLDELKKFAADFDKKVFPLLAREEDGARIRLSITVEEKIFKPIPGPVSTTVIPVAALEDPASGKYERGDLAGGRNIRLLLHERLSPGEWNLMYRFIPGRNPFLYQIAEIDSPIAFMLLHGATLAHDRKRFGLSLEYYYGEIYFLPADLNDVGAGDAVSELPFQQNIPLRAELHNLSVSALTHWTHFDAWGNFQTTAGIGVFYESGTIFYGRYGIKIPPVRDLADITPAEVETEEGQKKVLDRLRLTTRKEEAAYNAGGLRLQFSPYYERDIFITGFNILLDTAVPLNGHLQEWDRYSFRFLLVANAGFRFVYPITR